MLHADAPIRVLGEVVIAAEDAPRHRNFPSMSLLQNGDLLLVYGVSTDHQRTCDGVLVSRSSSDGGETWSDPRPLIASPQRHYSTNYCMTQLADGRIILHFWEWRLRRADEGPGARILHNPRKVFRVLRTFSNDNGMSWSEPLLFEPPPPFLERAWCYGRPHELEDGRIMLPVYGPVQEGAEKDDPEDDGLYPGEAWAMAVASSSDGGLTFSETSVVASDPGEGRIFNETDILRLRDGRFLAVLREGTPPHWSHRSYSADDGKTWTPYEQVNFKGQCPCLVQLRSGAVLCVYRDLEPGRPGMSASVSEDGGATWRWVGQIYSGANRDCGYPVIVRLADDRLFCAYYSSYVDGDCEIRGMWLSDDV